MSANFFIDTNIAVYAFSKSDPKSIIARNLIISKPWISTQVLSETTNVCLKKLNFGKEVSFENTRYLMSICEVALLKKETYLIAFDISVKYSFSFWDSLIIASALENNCAVLYTEDLQHNQLIENKLKIQTPFI